MSKSTDFIATTDNELLMQFARHRDQAAFRTLVERHAGLIMSVCRQVTRNEQDAEDAFQATLLIMARRADRLLHIISLGGWLHRVAFRIALRAGSSRSRELESRLTHDPIVDQEEALHDIHVQEIQRVLHEELRQIPVRYRNAIVLCDLEGKSRLEAARQLDCTEASVKAALARGRQRLRLRMLKRGTLLSLGMITTHQAIAATRLSPDLLERTLTLSLRQVSAGKATSPVPADSVQTLVREGTRSMVHSVLMKPVAIISVTVALVAVPLALLGQISAGRNQDSKPIVIGDSATDPAAKPPVIEATATEEAKRSDDVPLQEPEKADPGENEIDELASELLATLRQLVAVTEEQYRIGTNQIDVVYRARERLFAAQLKLARSRAERLEIWEKRLLNLRELETFFEYKHRVAAAGIENLLAVRVERLEAEIALLRERALENVDPQREQAAKGDDAGPAAESVALHRYVLGAGDVLGVYIENVLGKSATLPAPVIPDDPALPPAAGYPIPVLGDGSVLLPFLPPTKAAGKTLQEVADTLRQAYTEEHKIIHPGSARIMVTLLRRRTAEVSAALQSTIVPGDTLGIFVDGVIGDRDHLPVVNLPPDRGLVPAIGFPYVVQADGTIDLPHVGKVQVARATIPQLQQLVLKAYTIDNAILTPQHAVVLVSLVQKYTGE